jgi:hypothetical protein
VDATGLDEPMVDGCGDVASGLVRAPGKFACLEAAGNRGAAGAFLCVMGPLDDVAADTRVSRYGCLKGARRQIQQTDGEG